MVVKGDLDKRVCDIYEEEAGTNTLREWIKESEEEFDLIEKDLESITDEELNEYIEFLEYLWEK